MSRKPLVFLDGREDFGCMMRSEIYFLTDFINGSRYLMDGDILLGKDENRLYYKKEFIKLKTKIRTIPEGVDTVTIPENISKLFNDLIGIKCFYCFDMYYFTSLMM